MRNFKIILSITIVLAMSMYSCKKSKISEPQNQSGEMSYSKQIIQRINDFQGQMSSDLKSGTSISLDSAIWSMEASLNFNNAHPDSASANLVILKSYYNINIDANNKVLLSDVQSIYNLMEDALLYQYGIFPSIYKHVVFSDAKTDSIVSSTAFISVTNGFGINPAILYEPFDEGDDWVWGTEYEDVFGDPPAGKCDGSMYGVSDGSDELERRLNNPNIAFPINVGYTDIEIVEVNFMRCYFENNLSVSREFHSTNLNYCMQNEELTDFLVKYNNIIYEYNDLLNDGESILILNENEGARPNNKNFISTNIEDKFEYFNSNWFHHLKISYGVPYTIGNGNK